jgi:hypothetical protein
MAKNKVSEQMRIHFSIRQKAYGGRNYVESEQSTNQAGEAKQSVQPNAEQPHPKLSGHQAKQ